MGEDVENILLKLIQAADFDVKKAETGIIYIAEVDKIARKSENPSITRDVSSGAASSSSTTAWRWTLPTMRWWPSPTILRGMGAGGLRAILEEVLLNTMYELPSLDDVGGCHITGEVVRDNVNPTLVPRTETDERRKRSA